MCNIWWHKKTGTFEKPNKNWRNPKKKKIFTNWTITTCLLRVSNPNYQCLKITSCRWRPPTRMRSFTATTHFKSSRSFVSPCVCCMLCRMRLCRILQSMQHSRERDEGLTYMKSDVQMLRGFSAQEHGTDTTIPVSVLLWNLTFTKYISEYLYTI